MSRIRWYGPSLVLLTTLVAILALGPRLASRLTHQHDAARVQAVRADLRSNQFLADLSETFRDVARAVRPSVVHVSVRGRSPDETGAGSGWVYDTDGHIITNHHVVDGATRIDVRLHDGATHRATLINSDAKTDVAVLRIDAPGLIPAARAANTPGRSLVEQGDVVFAFGSPFAQFEFSMSQGVVSATAREIREAPRPGAPARLQNFIQTDAAINPGNSGGPLTNLFGEVVGMNTAILSDTRDTPLTGPFLGLGFAVPVDMVVNVADQIIESGIARPGYLGIQMEDPDVTRALLAEQGLDAGGVIVASVQPNGAYGPAAAAGVRVGDVVTHVDGQRVRSNSELQARVGTNPPGARVVLTLLRPTGETDDDDAAPPTFETLQLAVVLQDSLRFTPGPGNDLP